MAVDEALAQMQARIDQLYAQHDADQQRIAALEAENANLSELQEATLFAAAARAKELQAENAALSEIVRVVAEADNSDSSVCYQLCNIRWYGGETDAETMEMRHDAPCVVEKARAWLEAHPASTG